MDPAAMPLTTIWLELAKPSVAAISVAKSLTNVLYVGVFGEPIVTMSPASEMKVVTPAGSTEGSGITHVGIGTDWPAGVISRQMPRHCPLRVPVVRSVDDGIGSGSGTGAATISSPAYSIPDVNSVWPTFQLPRFGSTVPI